MKAYALMFATITSLASPSLSAIAQAPATPGATPAPAFLVADVHPSPSRLHPALDTHFTADRVVLRGGTLDDLIAIAYQVQPSDILGGPAWLSFDRFDINAKPPAGTKLTNQDDDPAVASMLRALLVDRFGLVTRVEQRPLPAFVLTVAKPGLLKAAADASADLTCQMQAQANAPAGSSLVHLTCHNATSKQFAEILHDIGSTYFNRPVIDQTGLTGAFDFDFVYSYDKTAASGGTSLTDALLKQLGLKIESKPVPTQVVVIQSINQKPTPNVADLDKLLPPPPPRQFDVAVIHEANPNEKNFNIDTEGHRVTVQFATLLTLIYKSFDEPPANIRNQPKWLNDQHWDITGTVASTGPEIPGHQADLDYEDVKEMLRSLLADRFKLQTHMATEPATVFALTADSPKMKLSPDTEHAGCAEGPGPDGKDLRIDNPQRDRLLSCQHITMEQFAVELHNLASGYVPAPVVDQTGLTGAYDFSISFSRAGKLKAPAAAPSAAAPSAPSDLDAPDPGGGLPAISLFDAIQKQLGLKLVKKDSVPTPVFVIDHVEDHPTEN